jgi:hypothetical protein
MNDNDTPDGEPPEGYDEAAIAAAIARAGRERAQPMPMTEHERHQAAFKERRMWAGYCRWKAENYRRSTARPEGPATVHTLHKPPRATEDCIWHAVAFLVERKAPDGSRGPSGLAQLRCEDAEVYGLHPG